MLMVGTLQAGLLNMAMVPSSDVATAAQRFAGVLASWAAGAQAMGVPAVIPSMAGVQAGFAAGERLPMILSKFWPTVVFAGMVSPPVGPVMAEPLLVCTPDATAASQTLATAMQANAMVHMVTFMVGGVPTVFPIM